MTSYTKVSDDVAIKEEQKTEKKKISAAELKNRIEELMNEVYGIEAELAELQKIGVGA